MSAKRLPLYVIVETFNTDGHNIGDRIVDLYHPGTAKWVRDHMWWAAHNGHSVESRNATQDEIDQYLASQREALAAKYNQAA